MSKVKIQGNASGTGIFTVAAPATNTDQTITLPDTTATLMSTAGGNFNANIGIALDGYPALKFRNAAGTDKAEIYVGTGAGDLNVVVNAGAAVAIDSSARVRMPYQPAFRAYSSPNYTWQTGVVNNNTTSMNIGNHYNTGTYRFVAPVAGRYFFWAGLRYYNATSGNYVRHMQWSIRKNGSGYETIDETSYNSINANSHWHTQGTTILDCAVNDYVDVNIDYLSTNHTPTTYGSAFVGYFLG